MALRMSTGRLNWWTTATPSASRRNWRAGASASGGAPAGGLGTLSTLLYVGGEEAERTRTDFLLQECDDIRAEIRTSVKETRALERNALIASAAIWAWALAHPNIKDLSLYIILWLPALIAMLCALRAWAVQRRVDALNTYLANVERTFDLPNSLGWATTFAPTTDPTRSQRIAAFWLILIAVAIIAAPIVAASLNK